MKDAHADVLLVTSLDEVAWLFNLRGSDVACNPVFVSYAALPLDGSAVLYVDEGKIPADVKEHLKVGGARVRDSGITGLGSMWVIYSWG